MLPWAGRRPCPRARQDAGKVSGATSRGVATVARAVRSGPRGSEAGLHRSSFGTVVPLPAATAALAQRRVPDSGDTVRPVTATASVLFATAHRPTLLEGGPERSLLTVRVRRPGIAAPTALLRWPWVAARSRKATGRSREQRARRPPRRAARRALRERARERVLHRRTHIGGRHTGTDGAGGRAAHALRCGPAFGGPWRPAVRAPVAHRVRAAASSPSSAPWTWRAGSSSVRRWPRRHTPSPGCPGRVEAFLRGSPCRNAPAPTPGADPVAALGRRCRQRSRRRPLRRHRPAGAGSAIAAWPPVAHGRRLMPGRRLRSRAPVPGDGGLAGSGRGGDGRSRTSRARRDRLPFPVATDTPARSGRRAGPGLSRVVTAEAR